MNNLVIGFGQLQVEASCYRAECNATRKAITEECTMTITKIKETRNQLVNFTHKLDDLLILMSKKFQISLLVEPFSKSTAEPILPEVGILPVISSLQQESDQAISDTKVVAGKINVTPLEEVTVEAEIEM